MEPVPQGNSSFNPKNLLIDHIIDFKCHSENNLITNQINEEEQKILNFISDKEKFKIKSFDEHHKEVVDFLSSKLKAVEKMNLDDECSVGEIEIRKIEIDKDVFPKSEHVKRKKYNFFVEKIKKKNSRKNSRNKNNKKNIILNHDGKIEKAKIENIDLIDDINLDIEKEIKEIESNKFFSNKNLLNSIINEMKEK